MTHIRRIIISDIGQLTCGIFILSFHLFVLCSLLCLLSTLLNLCHFPHFCGFLSQCFCLFSSGSLNFFQFVLISKLYCGLFWDNFILRMELYSENLCNKYIFCWENITCLVCFVLRCYLQMIYVFYFFFLLTRLISVGQSLQIG